LALLFVLGVAVACAGKGGGSPANGGSGGGGGNGGSGGTGGAAGDAGISDAGTDHGNQSNDAASTDVQSHTDALLGADGNAALCPPSEPAGTSSCNPNNGAAFCSYPPMMCVCQSTSSTDPTAGMWMCFSQ
jgi:hypothetical protein